MLIVFITLIFLAVIFVMVIKKRNIKEILFAFGIFALMFSPAVINFFEIYFDNPFTVNTPFSKFIRNFNFEKLKQNIEQFRQNFSLYSFVLKHSIPVISVPFVLELTKILLCTFLFNLIQKFPSKQTVKNYYPFMKHKQTAYLSVFVAPNEKMTA